MKTPWWHIFCMLRPLMNGAKQNKTKKLSGNKHYEWMVQRRLCGNEYRVKRKSVLNGRSTRTFVSVKISDEPIEAVVSFKYLGTLFQICTKSRSQHCLHLSCKLSAFLVHSTLLYPHPLHT